MLDSYLKILYTLWASLYDRYIDPLFRFDRYAAINALHAKPQEKILEIGIGTGLNISHYPPCKLTGIDFSKAMLNKAKQKHTNVILRLADARKLPFKNNNFDKAITTYVLRVSPEPKKIISEVARVIKKGGLFVIVDQFQGKNKLLLSLLQPFKLLLGWGKEYELNDLLTDDLTILTNKRFGAMSNTRLVVLKRV